MSGFKEIKFKNGLVIFSKATREEVERFLRDWREVKEKGEQVMFSDVAVIGELPGNLLDPAAYNDYRWLIKAEEG